MRRDSETGIGALTRELTRLQRRAARQKRNIRASPDAWQDWSATMEKIAILTQRLVVRPADNFEDLAAKFNAILWLIEVNESLLDRGDLRRLRRFGRDLTILGRGEA
jgi:hypothetical protein